MCRLRTVTIVSGSANNFGISWDQAGTIARITLAMNREGSAIPPRPPLLSSCPPLELRLIHSARLVARVPANDQPQADDK
jgi:hypothetical protein